MDLNLLIFVIISKIIDLDDQIIDLDLQTKDLDMQSYDFSNNLKNICKFSVFRGL